MDKDVETLVRLAIEQLRDGRPEDALLTLERTADPKWQEREECEIALLWAKS
jgi:hypothetical protein